KEQFQHGFQYYVDQVILARKVFPKNSPYYSSLNLNGSRIRSIDGYRSQAMKFYQVALDEPNISAALEAEFNITQEALQEGIRKIEDMEQAIQRAINADADSQVAASEEADLVEQSKKWRSKYLTVAKQALKDKPQLLEKLEIVVE
ncbi:MAG TPA: hypothetical protein VJ946_15000, partial [Bacteroidales bacterium]|nr:hypothetical protein [Bacteroidales bacterium]